MSLCDDADYYFKRSSEAAEKASKARRRGDDLSSIKAYEDLATLYHMRALALVVNSRDQSTGRADQRTPPTGRNTIKGD